MQSETAPTIETARRAAYITTHHGTLNVLQIAGAHLSLITLFFSLQYAPLWAGIPVAVIASWIHQRFLSEWAHEAAHYNLVPDKKWNDILANWLLTYWHGYKIDAYRTAHMRHHSADEYFAAGDPDTERLGIGNKRDLLTSMLRDVSGYTAVTTYFAVAFERGPMKDSAQFPSSLRKTALSLLPIAALHLFFVTFSFLAGFLTYYIVYMGCLVTLYTVLNRIRVYGQHLAVKDGKVVADQTVAARTINAGFLDRVFITSRLMMYHNEHHAKPALPYRALAAVSTPSQDPNAYMDTRWPLLLKFLRSLP